MIQAFKKRDAAAIAAIWTEEGEFIGSDNQPIHGRAELQKGYEEFFKTLKGKPGLEIQLDGLRFPSAEMAVAEVTVRLKNESELIASTWQDIALVREGGQWKLATVREWDRDIGLDASLNELGWLIGTWQAATPDRKVTITYEWDENMAFIRGKFVVMEGAYVIEAGTEIIGKDNAEGVIRGWIFQSDGGFGNGVWTRDGRKWNVDVHGVATDGKELTATTIYVHVDPNTFTWQAVSQAFDGVPVPDTQPVKVTRQGAAK
jgi:ketosteroid isomerase-like protein